MKTLMIVMIAALLYAPAAMAQQKPDKSAKNTEEKELKVVVKMQGGKVYETRDGKDILVTAQLNVNGTLVKNDGTLVYKDGHKDVLKEGDVILENGLVLRDAGQTFTEPGSNK